MCFSASASFTASAILAIIGIALLTRVKSKYLIPLALIPLFFAMQQFAEGVLWLSPQNFYTKNVFLFFAYVFWPIWIPLSLWCVEENMWRKQLLALCLGVGIVIGFFFALTIPQTTADFYKHSIHYSNHLNLERYYFMTLFLYCLSTVLPLFISTLRKIWVFGVAVLLSGIAIYWVDRLLFVSLWCFFAALFSLYLFFVVKAKN